MKVVFFDTDIISNWHKDDEQFRVTIPAALLQLERGGNIIRALSVVTYQELLAWGVQQQQRPAIEAFLKATFTPPVMYDERAVREAADLQQAGFRIPKRDGQPKPAYQTAKDLWFRDLAILGTAKAHNAHAVVTCSRDFKKYEGAVEPMKIVVVEAIPVQAEVGQA